MNYLKKIYCRVFQTGMRIALPFLPYKTPIILNSIQESVSILENQRVLLVTDASIRQNKLTQPLEDLCKEHNIPLFVFDETVANPTSDIIAKAVSMYQENHCTTLIGFGGGSSIDCAKAVGACIAQPKKSLAQMSGILKVHKKIPTLIAVPTTAGTGSETTLACVVTDSKTRHKYAINDFPLIPKYAILDPEVTRSLPKSLTASTGMDALTHAVEAYIGRSTTSETRQEAIEAIQLIFNNLENAYNNGNDMVARRNMLRASFLAGDSFSKSYVGYVHAVAHSLGGQYNIPHGLANAVLLPIVLKKYGKHAEKKLYQLSVATNLCDKHTDYHSAATLFIQKIEDMNQAMNIPITLSGIQEKDIPLLAHYADMEANPLYPVCTLWDANQLEDIYYLVMERKEYYASRRNQTDTAETKEVLSKRVYAFHRESN